VADRPDRLGPRRRSSDVPRLDQPQEFRRRFVPTPSFSQETFGALSEGFARWMGTAQFLFGMTVFVAIWLAWNTFANLVNNLAHTTAQTALGAEDRD